MLALCNFTPITRERSIRVSRAGHWTELLNSDALEYGGSGVGNAGGRVAEERENGSGQMVVTAPPLGCVVLRWDGA